ncbi:MAG: hypothetical protein H7Z40_06260 [Phycisphaerae bacterium]|nr:hypothetical protein [Gemmatimonadaceae bacterium]
MTSPSATGDGILTPKALSRVSFQGALGAFSELAIHEHWPEGATPVPRPTFADADVAAEQRTNAAAIASEAAASRYSLAILASDIQDIRENWTRFVVLRAC